MRQRQSRRLLRRSRGRLRRRCYRPPHSVPGLTFEHDEHELRQPRPGSGTANALDEVGRGARAVPPPPVRTGTDNAGSSTNSTDASLHASCRPWLARAVVPHRVLRRRPPGVIPNRGQRDTGRREVSGANQRYRRAVSHGYRPLSRSRRASGSTATPPISWAHIFSQAPPEAARVGRPSRETPPRRWEVTTGDEATTRRPVAVPRGPVGARAHVVARDERGWQ